MITTDSKKEERLGAENYNKQVYLMKIVEYNNCHNIIVEFQDKQKSKKKTSWDSFISGAVINPSVYEGRLGQTKHNYQGCLMKVIEYNNSINICVEFQDKYKAKVYATWERFETGGIKNPYYPSVYGVGIVGNKYPIRNNDNKSSKEYKVWSRMLERCYDDKLKQRRPTYKDVTCCEEWLLYDNFYEWLHSQENFDKWLDGERWHVDKDIIVKGNKVYSPETCCLVPVNINTLFIKHDKARGNCLIGVTYRNNTYNAQCNINGKCVNLGYFHTEIEAFNEYKKTKENDIKRVAQEEYDKGNITKRCFDAMMTYEVEITD